MEDRSHHGGMSMEKNSYSLVVRYNFKILTSFFFVFSFAVIIKKKKGFSSFY